MSTMQTKENDNQIGSEKSLQHYVEPGRPWFVYPLLAGAIISVSSAAVVFSSMSEISPFLLAAWRLQITALLLTPAGLHSFWCMTPEEKQRTLQQSPLIAASGLLLGAHFGSWVICIENTSLTHALLAGASPPVIIALGTWILRRPISRGELVGTAIAAFGGILISQSASSEKAVSLYGDLIGLLSAGFFVIYLTIGRKLRTWMPIFAYVLPVNAGAALFLVCASLTTEHARLDLSPHGLFGYLGSWSYCWRSFYLGAVPGIAGHVSFNALLKWLHPLLLALPGCAEPLIGSLLGLAVGVGTLPGLFTYLGGSIILAATVLVIVASYKREQAEQSSNKGALEPETVELRPEAAAENGEASALEGVALMARGTP